MIDFNDNDSTMSYGVEGGRKEMGEKISQIMYSGVNRNLIVELHNETLNLTTMVIVFFLIFLKK